MGDHGIPMDARGMAMVLPLVATDAHDIRIGYHDIPSGGHGFPMVALEMAMDDNGLPQTPMAFPLMLVGWPSYCHWLPRAPMTFIWAMTFPRVAMTLPWLLVGWLWMIMGCHGPPWRLYG